MSSQISIAPSPKFHVTRRQLIFDLLVILLIILLILVGLLMVNRQTAQQSLAAYQTKCSIGTASGYVGAWALFGTPTQTPTRTPRPTRDVAALALTATLAAGSPAKATATPSITPTAYALVMGNVARGRTLFEGKGACSTCHDVAKTASQLVGPSLAHIGSRGSPIEGQTTEDYLYESIVAPNAYIVPGFSAGVMPANYQQTLVPPEITDIVAYLLSLQ